MFQDALSSQWTRLFLIFGLLLFIISAPALAQQVGSIDPVNIIDKVIEILNGRLARGLAIIALIIMGIGCWYGFFDFRKIGFFMIGIIFVFGGAWIMDQLGVGGTGP